MEYAVKRYLVFSGYDYYPSGGWSDFKASFDSIDDAAAYRIPDKDYDWYEVTDLVIGEEV